MRNYSQTRNRNVFEKKYNIINRKWNNFVNIIKKHKDAIANGKQSVTIVIPDMISGAEIDDLVLTEMSKMKVISS